jgi:hypothetical protein
LAGAAVNGPVPTGGFPDFWIGTSMNESATNDDG